MAGWGFLALKFLFQLPVSEPCREFHCDVVLWLARWVIQVHGSDIKLESPIHGSLVAR